MSDWRLTITRTLTLVDMTETVYVVEGDGPPPTVEMLTPRDVPPPPPVGDPLAIRPGEDPSPGVFPTDGPRYRARDFDRNYPLGLTPPASDYYACEGDAGNPSIGSHVNAGFIAPGGRTDYGDQRPKDVGGLRLWVRVVAGATMDGAPLPPAPPYLIRRALAKGRLTP